MAVRRRSRQAPKAGPSASTQRVHAVDTLEQWDTLLAKAAASRRLVVVQFFQASRAAWLGSCRCHACACIGP